MINCTPKSLMALLIDAIMWTLKLSKKRSGVIPGGAVATYGFSTFLSAINSLAASCQQIWALPGHSSERCCVVSLLLGRIAHRTVQDDLLTLFLEKYYSYVEIRLKSRGSRQTESLNRKQLVLVLTPILSCHFFSTRCSRYEYQRQKNCGVSKLGPLPGDRATMAEIG